MNYDFDMLSVIPEEYQTKYAGLIEKFGLDEHATQQLAMFRDPDTALAISGACEAVRECFVASGFALNSFDSGLGDNQFAVDDQEGRTRVLSLLQENVEALPGQVGWNGFDIGDFFVAACGAMPAPRRRKTFADVRRRVRAPVVLMPSKRIVPRVLSRPLSTPAPGI